MFRKVIAWLALLGVTAGVSSGITQSNANVKIEEKDKIITNLTIQLENEKSDKQKYYEALAESAQTLEAKNILIENLTTSLNSTKTELTEAQTNYINKQAELEVKQEELNTANSNIQNLQALLESSTEDKVIIQEQLDAALENKATLETQLATLTLERNALQIQIDELIDENNTLKNTIAELELQIEDLLNVEVTTFDPVFANNTPSQIDLVSKEIAKNGYTSAQVAEIYGWNLGDTIPITLTNNETIELQIIGINHDILSSDHTSKAGLTLQMKDCLATIYMMNSGITNAGGYAASKMKTETLPTIKALLPQEWQDVIKLVDKKSANGSSSNYTETLTLSEDLFLLCTKEVFGSGTGAEDGENEGSWYEYYEINNTADACIKKYDKNATGVADAAIRWWLRSCKSGRVNYFNSVTMMGTLNNSSDSDPRGVSFALCI